jgi:hypothetical protein
MTGETKSGAQRAHLSHAVGKIGSAISRPYFLPSLIEVSHVAGRGAPLEMTGETKSGAQRAHSYGLGASGLQGPGSAPYSTLLCTLVLQPTAQSQYCQLSHGKKEEHKLHKGKHMPYFQTLTTAIYSLKMEFMGHNVNSLPWSYFTPCFTI